MFEPTDEEIDQAHELLVSLFECVRMRVPVGISHLAVASAAVQLAAHHAHTGHITRDALLRAVGNAYDEGPLV